MDEHTNLLSYLNNRGGYTVSVYRREGDPEVAYTLPMLAGAAAGLLRRGETVDWEPGDGTRYTIALLRADSRDWLCFLNLGPGMLRLREEMTTVDDYVISTAPQGGWRGLRPLLVALGAARPPSAGLAVDRLLVSDQRAEETARAKSPRRSPLQTADAALGRAVRLLVVDDVGAHSRVGEEPDSPCASGCKPSEGNVCGGPRCT